MKKKEPLIRLSEIQAIMEILKAERAEKKKEYEHIYTEGTALEGIDDSYTTVWKRGMKDLIGRIKERISNEDNIRSSN